METKQPNSASKIKAVIGFCGAFGFFIESVTTCVHARHYQLTGQPMPNGKGGFMSSGDGYLIALVLFLISAVWLYCAIKSSREK
jgi:hypothetical protein